MNPFVTTFTLALAWVAPKAAAFAVDSSCEDVEFIQKSAAAAVDMAAKAVEAIDPPDGSDRDSNVDRLIDLLFRGPDTQDSSLIDGIKKVYQGVAKFGTQRDDLTKPGDDPSVADEVNIYCNLDRVQKRKSDGEYVDSSSATILEDFEDSLNSCQTTSTDLAITWPLYTAPDRSKYLPSQITICPWFYQWARSKELNTWSDLRVKSGLAAASIPVATNVWPFTPIDAVTLLDKVLLHEFTHTHPCGVLDDVEMETDGTPGSGVAYGWKACTALAKQEDNNMQKTPTRNADTFALFASGVRLLNLADPVYIEDNGKVTSSRPSKRDVPLEIRYKQTPAAFEGFVTRIKAEQADATAGALGLGSVFGAGK